MYKIAITLNNSWYAYNFRLNLAERLKDNGYEVVFVAPYDKKYSELLKKKFKFFSLTIDSKGINPFNDFKTVMALYKLYKNINPDIILNFTIKPNIYSSIVAGFLNIKSIGNITGLGTIFIKQSAVTHVAKFLYKIALGFNSKVFFQNRDDRALFIETNLVQKNKVDLLPGSGVDVSKFKPLGKKNNGTLTFLLVARLLKDKAILEYINAIKIIKKKYTHVEFQLLGEIGVENKTAIRNCELRTWIDEKIINYLGTTDNVQNVLSNADCVVLPSYREGTPRSLLEAASMAKPIIATNVAGCREVVDDGVNGYLCNVRNAQDLADKIEMMIKLSDNERKTMGNAGREKILAGFNEEIVLKAYLKSIKEILQL